MTRTDFSKLVTELSRKMYGFAFRILQNKEEAEDAVQEVFIRLWQMGEKLDSYDSIEALATTMTKNHCIDQFRKRRRKEEFLSREQNNTVFPSPAESLESHESAEIIIKVVDGLPGMYRDVIKMREIEDLTYEEIAQKTGQKINALRVAISRARKMVRDGFNKYQYERKGSKRITGKVL